MEKMIYLVGLTYDDFDDVGFTILIATDNKVQAEEYYDKNKEVYGVDNPNGYGLVIRSYVVGKEYLTENYEEEIGK